ncbi:zinc finger protein 512 isoform X1 [Vombatus ursinus]|uniref:Zinc finger protein 512 n=2 Tax=Vombatus ursinus TaxID=29139 RepID=A0A4X2LZF8_VOMUR|nr:zinc finger protein 512 isoform X1 [Vombatus ursinus]
MPSGRSVVASAPGPTHFRQQKNKRSVEAKNRTHCAIGDSSFQGTSPGHDSQSEAFSASSQKLVNGGRTSIRKPTYWLEMRGIKAASHPQGEVTGGVPGKGKRKTSGEEDEDYEEFPQKKQKLSGKKQRPRTHHSPRTQSRYIRKDPPSYPAGSVEEQWYLEILDKGRVSCPTCRAVVRKTVEGLKKHMGNCRQEMYTCHHCGKQLRSLAGMKYHVMADHNNLPILKDGGELDEPNERERLRKVLKRMGKLKCTRESCSGSFTSIMGYLYHIRKCGKEAAELEKMTLKCHHCGKAYGSKAGLMYHLRSEHGPMPFFPESGRPEGLRELSLETGTGGRVQRRSAKVAVYYLQELANAELAKEWPKKKVLQDLVPDDRKLKYTRPGLPTFSQEVLYKWKSEIKMYHRVHCPNQGCESVYSSVSGLKAHLGTCTLGDFVAGKYKCLLCEKEFVSESGVKYHINSVHAEDWFMVNTTTTKSFEKLMKMQHQQEEQRRWQQQHKKRMSPRAGRKQPRPPEAVLDKKDSDRRGGKGLAGSASCENAEGEELEPEQVPVPVCFQTVKLSKTSHKRGRK